MKKNNITYMTLQTILKSCFLKKEQFHCLTSSPKN